MTYKDHLWSAIIGEAGKFGSRGKRITKARRDRYLKICEYWRRAQ